MTVQNGIFLSVCAGEEALDELLHKIRQAAYDVSYGRGILKPSALLGGMV